MATLAPARQNTKQLLVVDQNVDGWRELVNNADLDVSVLILDPLQNGLTQIADAVASYSNLDAIHIISHGGSGSLQLGSATLSNENLNLYTEQLTTIGSALSAKGDILLYGCNVAQGETGQQFIEQLSVLTGADVAASTNVTGDVNHGGDWVLESQTGAIEATSVISSEAQAAYHSTLGTPLGVFVANGSELWVTDGTTVGTGLVKAINVGGFSNPQNLTSLGNGKVLFEANNQSASSLTAHDVWVTDGTADGTYSLIPNLSTSPFVLSNPFRFAALGNGKGLFLPFNYNTYRSELWVTDGTAAGTNKVVVPNNFDAGYCVSLGNGKALLNVGSGLWVSDGTTTGTSLIKTIINGIPDSFGVLPSANIAFITSLGNGTAIFSASDIANGDELWITDGTTAGTGLLKDIVAGTNSSYPGIFKVLDNGKAVFCTYNATNGYDLWMTDGTTAGTNLVKSGLGSFGNVYPTSFTSLGNGEVLFSTNLGLWVTDGTTVGTNLLSNIVIGTGVANSQIITPLGNGQALSSVYDSTNGYELWITDGTTAGTHLVKDINAGINSSNPQFFSAIGNGKATFSAADANNDTELWITDGTAAGTSLLKNVNTNGDSSNPQSFASLGNGKVLFSAFDGINGTELWSTDGTAAGTSLVKDVVSGTTFSNPQLLTSLGNGKVLFNAGFNDNINGNEGFWVSDGTAAGTSLLKAGYASSSIFSLNNGKAVFAYYDAINGNELWVTDGTVAGTALVKDIFSGSSDPHSFVSLGNGKVLFIAWNSGFGLWITDGTTGGTSLVTNIGIMNGSITSLGNGKALFSTYSDLWITDGTTAGTTQLQSGTDILHVKYIASLGNGKAVFSSYDAINGNELWITDGTTAGTGLLKDINHGIADSNPEFVASLANGTALFKAYDASNVSKLWITDGTTAGTNILTGAVGSSFLQLGNGKFVFAGNDAVNGSELWITDGTAAGTSLVKDIFAGIGSSNPQSFTLLANGKVVFSAFDAVNGRELWITDGTSAGTTLVKDINTLATQSSNPSAVTVITGTNTAPTALAGTATAFTEQTPVTVANTITINDPNGDADWNGGSLQVQITANNSVDDRLALPAANNGGIWLNTGNVLMANTTVIGSASAADASNGSAWTFTFNAAATNALVQDTTRAIQFINNSDAPNTAARTVTFTATDKNLASGSAIQTVNVTAVNDAPTLTSFSTVVASGNEDSKIPVTFVSLQTQGNATDVDGTVTAFVIKTVNSGTLKIGTDAASATAWSASNNTVDATHQAYWTPALNANGILNAFIIVAKDNGGLESITPVQVQANVIPVPDLTISAGTNPVEGSTTGTFTFTLDSAAVSDLVVHYTLAGSATPGIDYTVSAGINTSAVTANTFTIAAGQTSATLNVNAVADRLFDPNETVVLNLASGSNYQLVKGASPTADFTAASSVAVGANPYSTTSGDFNGDGKLDLVTANLDSNNISVLLGDGNGGFTDTTTVAVGTTPSSITSGDFNSDGNLDLATANNGSHDISVRYGDGNGGFVGTTTVALISAPSSIISADFNGDGKLDLVTASQFNNSLSVCLGDGNGGFTTTSMIADSSHPNSIISGDFNGDGKLDLAMATDGNSISVRLGNGNGGFARTLVFFPLSFGTVAVGTAPWSITSGDFNGDGTLDLATANLFSNDISVRLGDGNGGFSGTTTVAVGSNPDSIISGDFNGDGKLDLATANINSHNLSVCLGDGNGGFTDTTTIAVGTFPNSIISGDFNSDGNLDLATANNGSDNISVLLNSTIMTPTATLTLIDTPPPANAPPTLSTMTSPVVTGIEDTQSSITFANLLAKSNAVDIDGTVAAFVVKAVSTGTLLIGADAASATAWATGSNDAIDATHNAYWTGAHDANAVLNAFTVVAKDNDGLESTTPIQAVIDVAAVPDVSVTAGVSPVEGGTPGTFLFSLDSPAPATGLTINYSISGSEKFTGFPAPDYTVSTGTNITALTTNTFILTSYPGYAVIVGDFTVAAGQTSAVLNLNALIDNVGTPSPPPVLNLIPLTDSVPDAHETVTLNLLEPGVNTFSNLHGSGYQLAQNDLTMFAPKVDYPLDSGAVSVGVGDFNNDGKLDLAVTNTASKTVSVLLGNATGFDAKIDYAAGSWPYTIGVGDFNNDGKLDLAVANNDTNTVSVLLRNAANTGFDPKIDYVTGIGAESITVGDFNNDGKPDLVITGGSTVSVLYRSADNTGFDPKVDYTTSGSIYSSVASGDFNNDGKLDIVVVRGSTTSVLYRNVANTDFDTPVAYAGASGFSGSIAVGDFNADGKLDIAAANSNGNTVSVLFRNADNTGFAPKVDYATGSNPWSVSAGDFNGDGKVDLAITNRLGDSVSVLLRNAANTDFNPKVDYVTGAFPYALATGDFNNDGKTDLVTTDFRSNAVSVLLNNAVNTSATLTITESNFAPVLVIPGTLTYTDHVYVDTFATATGTLQGSDVDANTTLTYGITDGTDNLDGTVSKTNAYGTLTVNKTSGEYSFAPDSAKIEPLGANATDSDSTLMVTVSDGSLTDSKPFTVTINQQDTTETNGNDNLIGTADNDTINALAGDDTIDGSAGSDVINGGLGNDILDGGVSDVLNSVIDTLNGDAGNDTFLARGFFGAGHYNGGTDIDTVDFSQADAYTAERRMTEGAGVKVNLATGSASTYYRAVNNFTWVNANGQITLTAIENIRGSSQGDNLTGDTNANRIDGGAGSDLILGGAGNDSLDGGVSDVYNQGVIDKLKGEAGNDTFLARGFYGAGNYDGGLDNDTLDFSQSDAYTSGRRTAESAGVNVNLAAHTASTYYRIATNFTWRNANGQIAVTNIENVKGTAQGDRLIGDSANNSLDGGAGNDVLYGASGVDILVGGDGNDTYYIGYAGDVIDVITEDSTSGTNDKVLSFTSSYTLADNVETLLLQTGAVTGTGNAGNNTLIGNSISNTLNGGLGNDSLDGGVSDVYNPTVTDTLNGDAGNDSFLVRGFYGAGIYDGGADIDTIDFSRADAYTAGRRTAEGAGVEVNLATHTANTYYHSVSNFTWGNANGQITVTNVENVKGTAQADKLLGDSADNLLEGGAGNDILTGANGVDVLTGGTGKDTYNLVESTPATDTITIAAGDSLVSSFDVVNNFTLGTGANTTGVDQFNLANTQIAIDTAGFDGVNTGTIQSHSINNGIISFDDIDSFAASIAINTSNLSNAIIYLQANITNGDTVAFVSGNDTYIFQDSGVNSDTLVELVGVTASSVNTTGYGIGAAWIV